MSDGARARAAARVPALATECGCLELRPLSARAIALADDRAHPNVARRASQQSACRDQAVARARLRAGMADLFSRPQSQAAGKNPP